MNKNIQNTQEWLEHRRKFIGASDAATVLNIDPWRTPLQLYEQKLGLVSEQPETYAMRRGKELESAAIKAFESSTGYQVFPKVVYHPEVPFMMASLDGITLEGDVAVEIKCPGKKTHDLALEGKIPDHYYAQMQHQLACTGLDEMWYYSFDGMAGRGIKVFRDDDFIENLISEEKKFWEMVQNKTPPPATDRDYRICESEKWVTAGLRLRELDETLKALKNLREEIKQDLLDDAVNQSCRGGGVTLTKTNVQGSIDYSLIPELEGVDLEQYRKPSKEVWTLRVAKQ